MNLQDWMLSGEEVCLFRGRDFSRSPAQYVQDLRSVASEHGLSVSTAEIKDPPGVLAQFAPAGLSRILAPPVFAVDKRKFPWVFCINPECKNRVEIPGGLCEEHE